MFTSFISLSFSVSAQKNNAEEKIGILLTGADKEHKDESAGQEKFDKSLPPMKLEPYGIVETLPSTYPESWVLVDESSFFNMFGGKVIVVDITEKEHSKRIKGMVDKSLLGNFTQSKKRGEYYIMETFHERGSRGPKTCLLYTSPSPRD